jgi:hypothetical protein
VKELFVTLSGTGAKRNLMAMFEDMTLDYGEFMAYRDLTSYVNTVNHKFNIHPTAQFYDRMWDGMRFDFISHSDDKYTGKTSRLNNYQGGNGMSDISLLRYVAQTVRQTEDAGASVPRGIYYQQTMGYSRPAITASKQRWVESLEGKGPNPLQDRMSIYTSNTMFVHNFSASTVDGKKTFLATIVSSVYTDKTTGELMGIISSNNHLDYHAGHFGNNDAYEIDSRFHLVGRPLRRTNQ